MKVLFDHPDPFLLAHGGFQIQIEQTRAALLAVGVEVEYLRWWDETQTGNLIHYFGRPHPDYIGFAHRKGIKVVVAQLLTGLGSRPAWKRRLQKFMIQAGRQTLPHPITARFAWDSFRLADACVANTPWEAQLMTGIFDAPPRHVHVIPNGVEEDFLGSRKVERGPWLICTATITERKRVVELAQAAIEAKTPLWVIGKPYGKSDSYAQRFLQLARSHSDLIRHEGSIQDRPRLAQAYRGARGFVLLSTMETRSLSAEEAAACECPLLLSDLPWAESVYQQHASYCPVTASVSRTAAILKQFYEAAPALESPPKPLAWVEVARQLKDIYAALLSTSR